MPSARRHAVALWRCGQQAALTLQDHIGRRVVSRIQHDIDHYRRVVAQCAVGREDINAWLVAHGWTAAYQHYSKQYVGQEREARSAGLGIWSGEFVMPRDWRRGRRLE